MPKLNGTFLGLHGPGEELYYHPMEFRDRIDLSAYFHGGNPPFGDSYLADPDKWDEILKNLAAAEGMKKLYFTESNSAHNLSYFLARTAYQQLGGSPKFLILNFDQHEDYEWLGDGLRCSNWGSYICQELKCDYLIVGRRTRDKAFLFPYKEGVKPKGITKPFRNASELIKLMEDYEQIYLTVDMDVLKGTSQNVMRTNWPHGDVPLEMLLEWLGALPSEKIAAMDVSGFPPAMKRDGRPFTRADQAIRDAYIEDLKAVTQKLCTVMDIAPYTEE